MRIDPTAPTPDWSRLEEAFEFGPEITSFFDLATGEIVGLMSDEDFDDPEGEATRAMIDGDPDRFMRIEPVGSREKYTWMERFVETVGDVRLAGRLEGALAGKSPFRRFKDTLHGSAELERWYAFERAMLRRWVVAWLEEHEITVGTAPPWPEPAEPPAPTDDALRRLAHECLDRVPSSHLGRVAALLRSIADGGA